MDDFDWIVLKRTPEAKVKQEQERQREALNLQGRGRGTLGRFHRALGCPHRIKEANSLS